MRILLVRPDAIGDVVLMVPLLNTIRQAYPDAEIYTLQQPYTIPLLQDHPSVTAIIPDWRKIRRSRGIKGFLAYSRYLRSFGFDMAFFPYLEPYYVFLAIAAGISTRVGDRNKIFLRPFLTHSVPLNFRNLVLHESQQSAHLVWGVKPEAMLDLTMNLSVSDTDRELAMVALTEAGGDPALPYIVIHPRSGGGNRPWLPAKYAALIDHLMDRSEYQIVLTGSGPKEIQVISDIRNFTRHSFVDISGKTPLRVLMGLISQATVVIGTDTGPTHIAAALGVPVVSVSPTKFVKALRWGPWRTPNRVVSESQACALVCRPYKCKKNICLDAIDSYRVSDAVLSVALEAPGGVNSIPTKHRWIQTGMHTMVYWAGRESQLQVVVDQYNALKRNGFVVHLGTRSWRFRRSLAAALGIESDGIAVMPPFDWVGMVWALMTHDITVVFVVGPVVGWYWFWVRQICALRQYCPPVALGISTPSGSMDEIVLQITAGVYP